MRPNIIHLIMILFILQSCFEKDYPMNNSSVTKVTKSEKIEFHVTKTDWYTKTFPANELTFGYVYFVVQGTTNAERITVQTYGDGLIGDYPIKIVNGIFNDTVQISFTHAVNSISSSFTFYSSTILKACLGSEILEMNFNSGVLQY
jgi:hypothetical protein